VAEDITKEEYEPLCMAMCDGFTDPQDWCPAGRESDAFEECLKSEGVAELQADDPKYQDAFFKCCGKASTDVCKAVRTGCEAFFGDNPPEVPDKEETERGCELVCDGFEEKPDWCPSGLGAGAIAGIVVGAVVVVGGIAGGLVYYFVIRKAAVVAATS
jgi:hypothetical protein